MKKFLTSQFVRGTCVIIDLVLFITAFFFPPIYSAIMYGQKPCPTMISWSLGYVVFTGISMFFGALFSDISVEIMGPFSAVSECLAWRRGAGRLRLKRWFVRAVIYWDF